MGRSRSLLHVHAPVGLGSVENAVRHQDGRNPVGVVPRVMSSFQRMLLLIGKPSLVHDNDKSSVRTSGTSMSCMLLVCRGVQSLDLLR